MKKKLSKELSYFVAILLITLSIDFMIVSDFGTSTMTLPSYVLSVIFPQISVGTFTIIIEVLVIVILICITKTFSFYYLLSFVSGTVYGYLIDFYLLFLPKLPMGLGFRVVYFISGMVCLGLAVALFVLSDMPLPPYDVLTKDLVTFFKSDYKKVKTLVDIIFFSSGIVISLIFTHKILGVGIGTVVATFCTGTIINYFNNFFKNRYEFVCSSEFGKKLESMQAIK